MIRLSLYLSILFIGLTMVLAKNGWKYRNIYPKQHSFAKDQFRSLRSLMGKLIDTETNTVYSIDGEKQQQQPSPLQDPETTATVAPVAQVGNAPLNFGEIACLAACHSCVETEPLENQKKRAADNCGPMCDCADSCFLMPAEEVGQIYSQPVNSHHGKECWWRTYTEMLNNSPQSAF